MRLLIQRVSEAHVKVNQEIVGQIQHGLLVLVGIEEADSVDDIDWLVKKMVQLRIFNDEHGVMNKSLIDVDGQVLAISQFTLHALTKKGNRPSYIKAARPEIAMPFYENFIQTLENVLNKKIEKGIFGADMKVSLINDGPVTIWIDSKNKE
jgi:D-tyrosyl-tRNA(Tyr) deacylase